MIIPRHAVVEILFAAETVNAVIDIPVMRVFRFDRLAHVAAVLVTGVLPNARKLVTMPNGFYEPSMKIIIILLVLYFYELIRKGTEPFIRAVVDLRIRPHLNADFPLPFDIAQKIVPDALRCHRFAAIQLALNFGQKDFA